MLVRRYAYLAGIAFFFACSYTSSDNTTVTMKKISEVPQESWDKLGKDLVFFGHQSVGFNILDGVKAILSENRDIDLTINEMKNKRLDDNRGICHAQNGKNKEPHTKIEAFARTVRSGLLDSVSLAGFKFCYIDIKSETDVEELFAAYRDTMASLAADYPEIRFYHVTCPLSEVQLGVKASIMKIIGKNVGIEDNAARNAYNELLRNHYGDNEPVFDLAAFESTRPDGTRVSKEHKKEEVYYLYKDYTTDGGHLSDLGAKKVGEQFLIFLADQISRQ